MESKPHRGAIRLVELTAIIVVLLALGALLLPAISAAREAARRNQCTCSLKQLGLGLQNYHDVYKSFPALSWQGVTEDFASIRDVVPGATFAPDMPAPNGYSEHPARAAGFSWLVLILPYLQETVLFNDIARASNKFEYEAFSTYGKDGKPFQSSVDSGIDRHIATIDLDEFICPGFAGTRFSTASTGTAQPPVSIEAYARLSASSGRGVAITNYVALSATHLACMALGPDDVPDDAAERPNGVLVPGTGLNMKKVLDGTSNTLMVCETKEPAVNSWYDGTVCWTVGANPSASHQPERSFANSAGLLYWWHFPPGTRDACGLNFGPHRGGGPLFAPSGTTPAQTQPVSWGPSSDHSGGVVMHLAADASVHALTEDIDPVLYLQLITRAGCEPTTLAPDVD